MKKMIPGSFLCPSCSLDQAVNKFFLARCQVHHAAMVMANQCNMTDLPNGYGKGNLELAIPHIGAASSDDKCEIGRNSQLLSVVDAHTNQQLSRIPMIKRAKKIVIRQQQSNRRALMCLRNVRIICNADKWFQESQYLLRNIGYNQYLLEIVQPVMLNA